MWRPGTTLCMIPQLPSPFVPTLLLAWDSLVLASKLQGSTCLCLPSSGMTSTAHHDPQVLIFLKDFFSPEGGTQVLMLSGRWQARY